MRAAIYARVSTSDKEQNPETQLLPLREYAATQGWATIEYVDQASAADLVRRASWARLLDDAARRKVDLILVWRIDRAFRSVLDAANTLARLRAWGVGLRSYQEPWLDTTSPFGEALYYITVAYAQLERGILAERVRAGMERARRQGKPLGRPRAEVDPRKWATIRSEIEAGRLSRRRAAQMLGVSPATLRRRMSAGVGIIGQGECQTYACHDRLRNKGPAGGRGQRP